MDFVFNRMPSEAEILAKYSTPGLRRNQLTRYGKLFQLLWDYRFANRKEVDDYIDDIFSGKYDGH